MGGNGGEWAGRRGWDCLWAGWNTMFGMEFLFSFFYIFDGVGN